MRPEKASGAGFGAADRLEHRQELAGEARCCRERLPGLMRKSLTRTTEGNQDALRAGYKERLTLISQQSCGGCRFLGWPARSGFGVAMPRSGMILIAASATLVCTLAHAADLEVVKAEPPTIYTPNNYLWSGVYVGGFIGGGWSAADWGAGTVPVSFPSTLTGTGAASLFIPEANFSNGGFVGGGRVGANYQVGPFVFGFEADVSGMSLKGHSTVNFGPVTTATKVVTSSTTYSTNITYATTSAYQTTADWATTFTGRVGYAFDRMLAYGKIGMAIEQDGDSEVSTTTVTNVSNSAQVGSATTPSTNSRAGTATRYGWAAGVGLEYAITNNWWTFVEYDHLGFLSQLMNFVNPATGVFTTRKVQLNLDRVVGGVDYHF